MKEYIHIKHSFVYFFIIHYVRIDNNMLNDVNFNKNSEYEFEQAYKLCLCKYTHAQLLDMLKNGSIAEKQIAALEFDSVSNKEDAAALISNLIGCDGKIREAVAFKINPILNNEPDSRKIFANISSETFAKATIDINANICRLVIDSASVLKEEKSFSDVYSSYIIEFSKEAINTLDKFIYKDKKYLINKQLFKLYWCLEALKVFHDCTDKNELSDLLEKCSNINEYTIREKVAQIVIRTKDFDYIKHKLMPDDNYYVRQVLNHPSVLQ